MSHSGKKSGHAKTQWQGDALSFSSKLIENGTKPDSSDSEWMDDKDDKSDTDEPHIQMASLYFFFLPRHLQPETVVFHDEKKVRIVVDGKRSHTHQIVVLVCEQVKKRKLVMRNPIYCGDSWWTANRYCKKKAELAESAKGAKPMTSYFSVS